MFGGPAVPLIDSQDVHATRERLCGEPFHVVRLARAVEAVKRDQRRAFPWTALPVTQRENPAFVGDVEVAARWRRQLRKIPRIAPAVQRHPMAVAKRWSRFEPMHPSIIAEGDTVPPCALALLFLPRPSWSSSVRGCRCSQSRSTFSRQAWRTFKRPLPLAH